MKREHWFSAFWSVLLGSLLSLAATNCLITAFDLKPVGLPIQLGAFALLSLTGAVGFRNKWSSLGVLAAIALGLGWLWYDGEAVAQIAGLLEKLSNTYDKAYHWGVIRFTKVSHDTLWPIVIWGGFTALVTGLTVSKALTCWGAVSAAFVPMMLCLVVTDTVPDTGYIMLWIFSLVLLILTAWARRTSPQQGNRLTAIALIPTALAVLLLFSLNPEENYVNRPTELRGRIEQMLTELQESFRLQLPDAPPVQSEPGLIGSVNPSAVDLQEQEPPGSFPHAVMQVQADFSGTVYLRGRSYDTYSGTGWFASGKTGETFPGTATPVTQTGVVTVRTPQALEALYLPYYPMVSMAMEGGQVPNSEGGYKEYSFYVGQLPQLRPEISAPMTEAARGIDRDYLLLSSQTLAAARQHLEDNELVGQTYLDTANAIATYVRSSAVYDLETPKMPQDTQDFALWFLEESDRGYCVHFASAAVVLLRAADIPARYVVGYSLPVQRDVTMTVYSTQAHAWAEYYDPGLQTWIILEATPADLSGQEPQPSEPATEPTQELTEPTQPLTEPSALPTTPTEPQNSTTPTEPQVTEPDPPEPGAKPMPGWLKAVLWTAVVLAMSAALILLQRQLRLRLHRKWLRAKNSNALALKLWQETVFLARLSGQQRPPRELEKLAQKAKYSQHSIQEQELDQLKSFLAQTRQTLKARSWLWQLVYRYFYVIY